MRFIETPFFKARCKSPEQFSEYVSKIADDRPELASKLLRTVISLSHQRGLEGVLHVMYEGWLDHCESVMRDHDNKMPWLVMQTYWKGVLGSQRQYKLTQLIEAIDCASDEHDCMAMLEADFDIFKCDDCGEWEFDDYGNVPYNQDHYVCRSCIENNYSYSSYYSEYIYSDNCRTALNEDGREVLIHEEDEDFTYDEDEDVWRHVDYAPRARIIGNYHSSKRSIRFRHDTWTKMHKRHFGVELEVEVKDGDRQDAAERIHSAVNNDTIGENLFFENDGSLSHGFELISHPMSLPAHRELWSWLKEKSLISNLRSHQTSSCGLHVHVSRDSMTKLQIAKMVSFVNDPENEPLIRAIARRYAEGYCRIKEKKLGTAHYSSDRYEAINTTSSNTLEFRLFKGSLKYESVISAIEFTNALVEFTKPCSRGSIRSLTTDCFMDFINKELAPETQTLRPYIANRLETA